MEGLPALWKGEETVQEVLAQQTLARRGEPSLQSLPTAQSQLEVWVLLVLQQN